MKILIAEDEKDIALSYRLALEERGHTVKVARNGEECLNIYNSDFSKTRLRIEAIRNHEQPFDVVLLDYKMPLINGMEVAKEILTINSRQRIMFASAYVRDTLVESIKQLNQVVELLQKPFDLEVLTDQIEDKAIYSQLRELTVDIEIIKAAGFRHDQLRNLLDIVRQVHKRRTF